MSASTDLAPLRNLREGRAALERARQLGEIRDLKKIGVALRLFGEALRLTLANVGGGKDQGMWTAADTSVSANLDAVAGEGHGPRRVDDRSRLPAAAGKSAPSGSALHSRAGRPGRAPVRHLSQTVALADRRPVRRVQRQARPEDGAVSRAGPRRPGAAAMRSVALGRVKNLDLTMSACTATLYALQDRGLAQRIPGKGWTQ